MKTSWFEKPLQDWTPGAAWEKENVSAACALLAELASLNGGEVIEDTDASEDEKAGHAVRCAREAIQRQINLYAEAGNVHIANRHFGREVKASGNKLLPFLIPKERVPRVELNHAAPEELEKLPGVGAVTAARIVAYRETVGPFGAVEEVQRVKGIGKSELEQFQDLVYIRPPSERPMFRSGQLSRFYNDPSIENYLQLKMEEDSTIQETLIRELQEARYELALSKYPPLRTLPVIRASSAKEEIALSARSHELESGAIAGPAHGRIVFDRQYLPFMTELLGQCKKSLRMVMFFARFSDEKSYPTDPLVQRMIEARKKGADIKVILDIDEADDPYDSAQINSEIFKYLESNKIDVVFDDPETVTHSKIIIVDSRHVVVGSHNWTAGSFYQYDDTSLYVDSEALAADYVSEFDDRWKRFSTVRKHKPKSPA